MKGPDLLSKGEETFSMPATWPPQSLCIGNGHEPTRVLLVVYDDSMRTC